MLSHTYRWRNPVCSMMGPQRGNPGKCKPCRVEFISRNSNTFTFSFISQNGHRFADDTFKRIIFLNENIKISIKISLKFVPKGPINNIPALVQIMGWRRSCDNPLSEPMMVSLLTHICVTRPQWVKSLNQGNVRRQDDILTIYWHWSS